MSDNDVQKYGPSCAPDANLACELRKPHGLIKSQEKPLARVDSDARGASAKLIGFPCALESIFIPRINAKSWEQLMIHQRHILGASDLSMKIHTAGFVVILPSAWLSRAGSATPSAPGFVQSMPTVIF